MARTPPWHPDVVTLRRGPWPWRGAARTARGPPGRSWTATRTGDLTAECDGQTVASCNITRSDPVVAWSPAADVAAAVAAGAVVTGPMRVWSR